MPCVFEKIKEMEKKNRVTYNIAFSNAPFNLKGVVVFLDRKKCESEKNEFLAACLKQIKPKKMTDSIARWEHSARTASDYEIERVSRDDFHPVPGEKVYILQNSEKVNKVMQSLQRTGRVPLLYDGAKTYRARAEEYYYLERDVLLKYTLIRSDKAYIDGIFSASPDKTSICRLLQIWIKTKVGARERLVHVYDHASYSTGISDAIAKYATHMSADLFGCMGPFHATVQPSDQTIGEMMRKSEYFSKNYAPGSSGEAFLESILKNYKTTLKEFLSMTQKSFRDTMDTMNTYVEHEALDKSPIFNTISKTGRVNNKPFEYRPRLVEALTKCITNLFASGSINDAVNAFAFLTNMDRHYMRGRATKDANKECRKLIAAISGLHGIRDGRSSSLILRPWKWRTLPLPPTDYNTTLFTDTGIEMELSSSKINDVHDVPAERCRSIHDTNVYVKSSDKSYHVPLQTYDTVYHNSDLISSRTVAAAFHDGEFDDLIGLLAILQNHIDNTVDNVLDVYLVLDDNIRRRMHRYPSSFDDRYILTYTLTPLEFDQMQREAYTHEDETCRHLSLFIANGCRAHGQFRRKFPSNEPTGYILPASIQAAFFARDIIMHNEKDVVFAVDCNSYAFAMVLEDLIPNVEENILSKVWVVQIPSRREGMEFNVADKLREITVKSINANTFGMSHFLLSMCTQIFNMYKLESSTFNGYSYWREHSFVSGSVTEEFFEHWQKNEKKRHVKECKTFSVNVPDDIQEPDWYRLRHQINRLKHFSERHAMASSRPYIGGKNAFVRVPVTLFDLFRDSASLDEFKKTANFNHGGKLWVWDNAVDIPVPEDIIEKNKLKPQFDSHKSHVWILRHGFRRDDDDLRNSEVINYHPDDPPLSTRSDHVETMNTQMSELVKNIEETFTKKKLTQVIMLHSPFKRCIDTANLLRDCLGKHRPLQHVNVTMITCKYVAETRTGLESKSVELNAALVMREKNNSASEICKGMEHNQDVQPWVKKLRLLELIENLSLPTSAFVVVSHNGVIRDLLKDSFPEITLKDINHTAWVHTTTDLTGRNKFDALDHGIQLDHGTGENATDIQRALYRVGDPDDPLNLFKLVKDDSSTDIFMRSKDPQRTRAQITYNNAIAWIVWESDTTNRTLREKVTRRNDRAAQLAVRLGFLLIPSTKHLGGNKTFVVQGGSNFGSDVRESHITLTDEQVLETNTPIHVTAHGGTQYKVTLQQNGSITFEVVVSQSSETPPVGNKTGQHQQSVSVPQDGKIQGKKGKGVLSLINKRVNAAPRIRTLLASPSTPRETRRP